jgi:predicted pyridoxine 5'-phosphate oxidase superfamily flavin-nucleotide-binding protein
MGQQYSELNEQHMAFIPEQKIYFVGTATETGSVNLSPKGGDFLRIVNTKEIAWLNLTGSGNEKC